MTKLTDQLNSVAKLQQKLALKERVLLEKAYLSNNPSEILKASQIIEGVQQRQQSDKKSVLIDPYDFQSSFGYKDKPFSLSYSSLRRMAKAPIINSIIKTRKNQVADFAEPQTDKFSTGFIIRKKQKYFSRDKNDIITLSESRKIEEITEIVLNCGVNNSFESDDFDTFIRKITDDSLTFDQMNFETVLDRRGRLHEFFAAPSDTFRIADSYIDDEYDGRPKEKINGYYPSYVQVINGEVKEQFYPWELCFGVRNPVTDIRNYGYGCSELEDLVATVTSMLWGDEYNRRFFSQGSAPKGMLKVKGQVGEKAIQAFRQEWLSMIAGVNQSWKTPIVEGDIEWIDMQKNNRDMEYSQWQEYLIKLSCSIYCISPEEIGFTTGTGKNALFEGGKQDKLDHSKDKGLYPLLKFLQRKLNKHVIQRIDSNYELVFTGMNGLTMEQELEMDIKKLTNFMTVNEIRIKYNLSPVEGGDVILNSVFAQSIALNSMNSNNANSNNEEDEETQTEKAEFEGIKSEIVATIINDIKNLKK